MYKIYYLYEIGKEDYPKYIGITKYKLKQRLSKHIYDSKKTSNLKSNWIKSVIKRNSQINIKLIKGDIETLEEVYKYEKYYIKLLKEFCGFRLKNTLPGGANDNYTSKPRKKMKGWNSKRIVKYTLEGELIKTFDCIADAAKEGNISRSIIGKMCENIYYNPAKSDHIYHYENDTFIPLEKRCVGKRKHLRIYSIDKQTGEKILHKGVRSMCKTLGLDQSSISRLMARKGKHKKYFFAYYHDGKITEKEKTYNEEKSKPVIQYTLEGIKLYEYKSITEAFEKTKIARNSIKNCLNSSTGKSKYGKYMWKYKNS